MAKKKRSRKKKGGRRGKPPYSQQQLKWAFATHKPFAKKWARRAKGKKLPRYSRRS